MNDVFGNEEIQFPISYVLKVIYIDAEKAVHHNIGLKILLSELGIPHRDSTFRNSGQGRYVSISIPVEIADRCLFDSLYARLKEDPQIKCAM